MRHGDEGQNYPYPDDRTEAAKQHIAGVSNVSDGIAISLAQPPLGEQSVSSMARSATTLQPRQPLFACLLSCFSFFLPNDYTPSFTASTHIPQ